MKKYIFIIILLFVPILSTVLRWLQNRGSSISKQKLLVFVLIGTIFYLLFAVSVMAQYQLETGLPNAPSGTTLPQGSELPSYIRYLFIFGLGSIGILALGVMMFGGIQYILAAGNVAKTEEAKAYIQQALFGLGLLLVSYLLLRTINPDLVNLNNPNLTPQGLQTPSGAQSH